MPFDEDELLTAAQAAQRAQVSEATIRSWAYRGHLKATKPDAKGRPLYAVLDVARAEAATRTAARRNWPVAA